MQRVLLLRRYLTSESTGGIVFGPSGMQLYSLELPWKNNSRRISCIPEGKYECVWHNSPKFGWVYLVKDVPDRTHILFHPGNHPANTWGCILLGKTRGVNRVWNSRQAIQEFTRILGRKPFKLEIATFAA